MKTLTAIIAMLLMAVPFMTEAQHSHHNGGEGNFTTEITNMIHTYLEIKDALIASEAEVAITAASQMQDQLKEIGEHRLEGSDHMKWMEHYSEIESQLSDIAATNDLNEIRPHFYKLSDILIESVKTFGIEGVIYHQYCPMAFGNEGGSWLSKENQVKNPYMPETMLRCGRVIEKI